MKFWKNTYQVSISCPQQRDILRTPTEKIMVKLKNMDSGKMRNTIN